METPAGRRPFYRVLYIQVLIGVSLGILVGALWPETGAELRPLGDGFIRLVRMIIAPVIFVTVVSGIAGMASLEGVGRIGAKALGYFLVVSTFALVVGLVVANVVRPGAGLNIDPSSLDPAAVAAFTEQAHDQSIAAFLLRIIPDTFVSAFTSGEILQTLFVSILVGVALAMLGERAKPVKDFVKSLADVVFMLVRFVMYAAPIGAFGAMAFTIGRYGLDTLLGLAGLVATFYATSLIFIVGVLGLIALTAGFSIFRLIVYLKEELLLVLGTSSSESALPLLIQKLERAGCPKPIVGLVVPAGYSFNLDGTNIYMTLAALFIAQATNTPLSFEQQALLLLVAMISSKGAAGVTGAGFITLAATLQVVPAIPLVGMAIILGIDRFMSECRAITNFIGNAVATIVVARWEKSVDMARLNAVIAGRAPPVEAQTSET